MKAVLNLLFLFLLGFSGNIFAQEGGPQLPEKCGPDGFSFQNKQIIFNNDQPTQRIFILHNVSQGIVMLAHDKVDPGASAGWQSKLDKDQWSMVAVSQQGFSLGCMLYSPPNIGPVDCGSVLAVCAIPSAISLGGYWIAENKSLDKLLETAKSRGINM